MCGGDKNLEFTGKEKDFLNRIALVQKLRSIINKWDLVKLKSFWVAKETSFGKKHQTTEWEKILSNCTFVRSLIYKLNE